MKKSLKILVIEDNKYQALLVEREISTFFEEVNVTLSKSRVEALSQIDTNYFDVAIIDLNLNEEKLKKFITIMRSEEPNLPIIVVADINSVAIARNIGDCGVDEILIKDDCFYAAIPRLIKEIIGRKLMNRKEQQDNKISRDLEGVDLINLTAGTLSHEINNPLMTILGLSELILSENYKYDRELAKKMKIIQKSAHRIKTTLQKLSNISVPSIRNIESGQLIDPQKSRILVKKD